MHGYPPKWWLAERTPTFRGLPVVWRAVFETDRPPLAWSEFAKRTRGVWVPSRFVADRLVQAGVPSEMVTRVPPVHVPLDGVTDTGSSAPERRGFCFLSVLSWHLRKGWDVLLEAYLTEFRAQDDTELVLKISPFPGVPFRSQVEAVLAEHRIRDRRQLPRVRLVDRRLSPAEMARLYADADAFVLPSRGEGWGMPYMEAMAAGLPTIGTNWGGHLDYMEDGNSYLIDYDIRPVSPQAAAEWRLFAGQRWAEPDVGHLRDLMRKVRNGGPDVERRAQAGRRAVLTDYTAEVVGPIMVDQLDRICAGPPLSSHAGADRTIPEVC